MELHAPNIGQAIAEIFLVAGQPCTIESDIAELVQRDFSLAARIARARRHHRPSAHLVRYQRLARAYEVAA